MRKKWTKKAIMLALIASLTAASTSMAAVGVDCNVSKSGLTKKATGIGYSCAVAGAIIYGTNGSYLDGAETAYYNTNATRFAYASYTGLSAADYGYAYALDTAGNSAYTRAYY